MLSLYKYVFAQSIFILILAAAIYYFNRFLTEFFETRPIPSFWTFFLCGLSFYWLADSVLFMQFITGWPQIENYALFYSILQPIGAVVAAYGIYKVEEETRNV